MTRALITGASGFAGSHLAEHLLAEGYDVAGIIRPGSGVENLKQVENQLKLYRADIRDSEKLKRTLSEFEPDYVYHLAALSNPRESVSAPRETIEVNVIGQVNLFEALAASSLSSRVLVVGSVDEYDVESTESPFGEETGFAPLTPYGLSKVSQDLMGLQYFKNRSLPAVRVRSFNHTGPRRPPKYVLSSWARQLIQVEAGDREPVLETGNLHVDRDFTDVRDTVRAYRMILEQGRPGEVYNVCSGEAVSLRELVDLLLDRVDFEVEVKPVESRKRSQDPEVVVGDNTRIKRATGWSREFTMGQTLEDLLNYWRTQLA